MNNIITEPFELKRKGIRADNAAEFVNHFKAVRKIY